ncbi:MAG: hypothetical protein WA461_01340 [Nitrososphaeraceae archaeon]
MSSRIPFHSHEVDENRRCIPDSEECAEGYVMNSNYPECQRREYVCEKYPTINECITEITNLQNNEMGIVVSIFSA